MKCFRKAMTPWLAADCFETRAAFAAWLRRRLQLFSNLRMVLLIAAVLPLLIGYVLDRHGIMLLTILPLVLVLLLSMALERMKTAAEDQNNP